LIKPKDAQEIFDDLKKLHGLWLQVKKFLGLAFTTDAISSDMEYKFLEVKSQTSKFLRVLADKIDSHQFKYEPEKVTALLRQAISVNHIRGLPVADRQNMLILWHEVFIHITQVLGAFHLISEGYQPRKKERKDTSMAALKKGVVKEEKKKGGSGMVITVIILVALIAGAVYILMNR